MKVSEIMTTPVIVVQTTTPASEAAAMLAEHNITAMPVLDEDGRLVGMISEGDLLRDRMLEIPGVDVPTGQVRRPTRESVVGFLMSTPAVCMSAGAKVAGVVELMLGYDVRSVPITDGGTVVGIISRRDLLRAIAESHAGDPGGLDSGSVEPSGFETGVEEVRASR